MYAYIRGIATEKESDRAVLEASGVGYELFCSAKTLDQLKIGDEAKLLTHFYISDGIMALYGFFEEDERGMFRRLISVTRVGPKLAIAALGKLSPQDIAAAVVTDNADAFAGIPGLGKKTAQRILLELKEKVDAQEMVRVGLPVSAADETDLRAEAVAALVGLGYDGAAASRTVASIEKADTIEQLITLSLRKMAKQ